MSRTNSLTQAVLHLVNASGFKAWRNGNHAVYSVSRRAFMKNPTRLLGVPDITGYRKKDGKALYIEIKTGRDKLSEEQIKFLEQARRGNCIAFVVESITQVMPGLTGKTLPLPEKKSVPTFVEQLKKIREERSSKK